MQVLYPLMYLIYSLKMYSMYWTDLFERYVENGRQNVCGHYSQKVPSLSLPSSPRSRWWYVCWEWVLVGGQNVGLGTQPTTPKKTDSSSCSDQTSPPLPIVHSLCHCRPAICVFALAYLCLCSYVFACFPDQTNLIPLSLFAPFRWTKIVWEVFWSHCYLTLKIRFVYISMFYMSIMNEALRHCSLHINHIYLASFLIIRFWHFLVIRFWHFSTHCYYSLDLKSWSF